MNEVNCFSYSGTFCTLPVDAGRLLHGIGVRLYPTVLCVCVCVSIECPSGASQSEVRKLVRTDLNVLISISQHAFSIVLKLVFLCVYASVCACDDACWQVRPRSNTSSVC